MVEPNTPASQPSGAPASSEAAVSAASDEPAVRVVVVDDQAPFRRAARSVLDRTPGFALVGEAADGLDAVARIGELGPDLVLMDIKMPGLDGIEATRRIARQRPGIVVFLLSTYDRADLPDGVSTSGAAAYLHKEELSPRLLADLWDAHGPAQAPAPSPAPSPAPREP